MMMILVVVMIEKVSQLGPGDVGCSKEFDIVLHKVLQHMVDEIGGQGTGSHYLNTL